MVESIIPRPQEPERHTEGELPETKIFDLLSSVGNGENKSLELIMMKKGVIYSARALHSEVMTHQDQNRRWKMNPQTPFSHCKDSLSPIGLVTKEAVSPDGTTWGYEITDYGLTTGFDFVGLLLKWSYDHPNFSLYQMFTSTVSPSVKDGATLEKKRAQETRYKILWEIVTNPSNRIRQIDIANAIDEYPMRISTHLYNLGKNGVIVYESTQQGQPAAYYRLKETVPNKEPEPHGSAKTLSTRVYKAIMQKPNEYLSSQQIADLLIKEYPEYGKRSKREFPNKISGVLSHFGKQGYVERKKFIGGQFLSEVTLSEEQKEAIVSLVTLVDKFQKGDTETISEGRTFAQRVLNNPQIFSELMLKAKEASPFANATDKETTLNNILAVLQQHPNSTARQIRQILEEDYDKKLSHAAISLYVRSFVQEGIIETTKTKSGNVYRLTGNNNQEIVG